MIQQTSILAYQDAKTRLNRTQQLVYEALEDISPATNKMIAKHLGWEINSVTPRVLELRVKKRVVEAYKATDVTGRKAIYWKPRVQYVEAEDTY